MKPLSLIATVVTLHAGAAWAGPARVVELEGVRIEVPSDWKQDESGSADERVFNCPDRTCMLDLMAPPPEDPGPGDRRAQHERFLRLSAATLRGPGRTVRVDDVTVSGAFAGSRMTVTQGEVTAAVRALSMIEDGRRWAWAATCVHKPPRAADCARVLDSMSLVPGQRSDRPPADRSEPGMMARIRSITANVLLGLVAIALIWQLVRRRRR